MGMRPRRMDQTWNQWPKLGNETMPSRAMPYEWFDTPNLHLTTPHDFEDLAERLGLGSIRM